MQYPATTMVVLDFNWYPINTNFANYHYAYNRLYYLAWWHGLRLNALFDDGHVASLVGADIDEDGSKITYWTPDDAVPDITQWRRYPAYDP